MINSNFFQSLVTGIRSREGLIDLISDSTMVTVDYLVSKSISYTDIISSGVKLGKVKDIGLKYSYLELFGPSDITAEVVTIDDSKDYVVVKGKSLPFSVRLFVLLREKMCRDIEESLRDQVSSNNVTWAGYPDSLLPRNIRDNKIATNISAVVSEFDREDQYGFFNVISTVQSLIDIVKRAIVYSLSTEEHSLVKSLIYFSCVNNGNHKHIIELANESKSLFPIDYRTGILDKALNNDTTLSPMLISNVLDTVALRLVSKLSIDILKFDVKDPHVEV